MTDTTVPTPERTARLRALLLAAVQARIDYWEHVRILEAALDPELSDRANDRLVDLIDEIADVSVDNAQVEDFHMARLLALVGGPKP